MKWINTMLVYSGALTSHIAAKNAERRKFEEKKNHYCDRKNVSESYFGNYSHFFGNYLTQMTVYTIPVEFLT